jgi:hypothetical protein
VGDGSILRVKHGIGVVISSEALDLGMAPATVVMTRDPLPSRGSAWKAMVQRVDGAGSLLLILCGGWALSHSGVGLDV